MSHTLDKLFLGAGAMKAGTTWLYKLLSKHPQVYFTPEKEIHYFAQLHSHERALSLDRRLNQFKRFATALKTENYNYRWAKRRMDWFSRWIREPLDDEWYFDLFRGIKPGQYAADFSNLTCLIDDSGWGHVKSLTPHLRVLYIIRSPLDRLWSHIKFHLQVTGESEKLEQWSPNEIEDFARKTFIWQNGEYGKIVAQLQKNLQPDQLMISFFEDIHASPRAWLAELSDFLEIEDLQLPPDYLATPINKTADTPMPHFFPEVFRNEVSCILDQLQSCQLKLPKCYISPQHSFS